MEGLGEEHITNFTQAVKRTFDLAMAKLPQELHGHLERAHALVLHRHVWLGEDGRHAQVLSSDGETWYRVNGNCTCLDAPRAPQGMCKHKIAVMLYRRASELLAASGGAVAVASAPAALPEAPASVNVRVMIDGHECQMTLRDTDEDRLLTRLSALLARYPAAPCGGKRDTASAPAPTGTPTCPHHGPGKESTKAPGTWYCTKRMADQSYCTWRHPAK